MTDILTQQISREVRSFRMEFNELAIEPSIIEDYIGFSPGTAPEPFPDIIEEIFAEAAGIINPVGGFAVFENIRVDSLNKRIAVQDVLFNTHSIVTKRMNKATTMALYACTAGIEITRLASDFNRKGHAVHAYIVDTLGSIIVERAMDTVQERLKSIMQEQGFRITNRYSPGYCSWDIREQEKLFGLLPDGFCGISLTDSMLMKPIKSVSGIIGIGKDVTYDPYTCKYCKDINCLYRGKR